MKKLKLSILFITILSAVLFCLQSCVKEKVTDDDTPAVFHPFGAGKGQFTVYAATDLGLGVINCKIDGQTVGAISHYSATTACGSGDVNVILSAGSHTFSGTSQSGSVTWNFTFTITEDQCLPRQLTYSGGGGGGGGGLPSTTQVTFKTTKLVPGTTSTIQGGPITVSFIQIRPAGTFTESKVINTTTDLITFTIYSDLSSFSYSATNSWYNWPNTVYTQYGTRTVTLN